VRPTHELFQTAAFGIARALSKAKNALEFDSDAAGKVSNDARLPLSHGQRRANRGSDRDAHRCALTRDVNQCRKMFLAIWRGDRDLATLGLDALLPTIVRRAKHVALNKPGDAGGKLFDFARRSGDLECETILQLPRDLAVHTAKLVDIGDDVFANLSPVAAFHGHAARRQIDCCAGALKATCEHVPTRQPQPDAFLLAPPF